MKTELRCEGFRRYGGAFTLGISEWVQCKNVATVMLTLFQNGAEKTLPGCQTCWSECIEGGIKVLKVTPISRQVKRGKRVLAL